MGIYAFAISIFFDHLVGNDLRYIYALTSHVVSNIVSLNDMRDFAYFKIWLHGFSLTLK